MASPSAQPEIRRQTSSGNQERQNGGAENSTENTPHNSSFVQVPFFVLFIGIASTLRAWPYILPRQVILQLTFLLQLALPVFVVGFFPHFFVKHRALFVTTSRLGIVLLPSSRILITRLVNADSNLGQKWAYTNRIGALGILIFASRSLVFFASSLGTHMDFLPTVLIQALLAITSYHTEPELCSAKLASSPMILSSFNAVQSFLSSAWTIVLPFPHITPPPAHVIDLGTSLTAITFMIKVAALLTPIVQSAIRAARNFCSEQEQQQQLAGAHRQFRNRNSSSRAAARENNDHDYNNEDDIHDVVYDPIENNLVPIIQHRPIRQHNSHRHSTFRQYSTITTTTTTTTTTGTINGTTSNGTVLDVPSKKPPFEVRIVLAIGNLQYYPIHATWLAVAMTCVLWACLYSLASHVCAVST